MIIQMPDTSGLETKITEYSSYPEIRNVSDYVKSAEALVGIKALRVEIEGTFNPIIKAADALTSSIRKTRDGLAAPLDSARKSIEGGRIAFEAAREMDRMRATVEQSTPVDEMDAMGFDDPSSVVPFHAPVMPDLPKTPGVSSSGRWSAEIYDFSQLVKAVADGKAPIECLLPNQPFINRMAQTSRTTMNVPGVRPVHKKFTSVRS